MVCFSCKVVVFSCAEILLAYFVWGGGDGSLQFLFKASSEAVRDTAALFKSSQRKTKYLKPWLQVELIVVVITFIFCNMLPKSHHPVLPPPTRHTPEIDNKCLVLFRHS